MTTSQQEIDGLRYFCGDNGIYNLSAPWSECGWIYATDGAVAVRIPSSRIMTPAGKTPKASSLNWNHVDITKWEKMKQLDRPFRDGRIRFDAFISPRFHSVLVSTVYVYIITHHLNDVEFFPDEAGQRLLFRFAGGGQGFLMQLNKY